MPNIPANLLRLVLVPIVTLVAACSEVDQDVVDELSDPDLPPRPLDLAALAIRTLDEYRDNQGTSSTMPDSGGASYHGYGILNVEDSAGSPTGTHFFGQLDATVFFNESGPNGHEISGEISDIFAQSGVTLDDLPQSIIDGVLREVMDNMASEINAQGEIIFTASNQFGPNFVPEFGGTVTFDGTQTTIDGSGSGQFKGDDAITFAIVGNTNQLLTITVDGTARTGSLTIVGKEKP